MIPTIDILMPVFNCGPLIQEAIASVQQQTYTSWVLHITDDASTDDTLEKARAAAAGDPRIQVYAYTQRQGAYPNLEWAIGMGSAPLLAKLDGDDTAHPDWLANCLEVMEKHKDLAGVFVRFHKMDRDGQEQPSDPFPEQVRNRAFLPADWVRQGLKAWNGSYFYPPYSLWFQGPGLFRRSVVVAYLPFQNWPTESDIEMWFRIGSEHPFFALDEPLYHYRQHSGSATQGLHLTHELPGYKYLLNRTILDFYLSKGLIAADHHRSEQKALNREFAGHRAYMDRKMGRYLSALRYYLISCWFR